MPQECAASQSIEIATGVDDSRPKPIERRFQVSRIISSEFRDHGNEEFVEASGIQSMYDSISGFIETRYEGPSWFVRSSYNSATQMQGLIETQSCSFELLSVTGNLRKDITQSLFD